VEFHDDKFEHFGSGYTMKIEGGQELKEFLVHFPSFIKLAGKVGLTMLEISNLLEFYDENKKNYGEQLKQLNVLNKEQKIEGKQKDLIGLYTTFIFQKEPKIID